MSNTALASRFASAARSLVGTPFRLHGRDPSSGLDCVGLVTASLEKVSVETKRPQAYRLRNSSIETLLPFATLNGFENTHSPIETGDLLLCLVGPAQYHLLICDADGETFIHAHAGLRKVTRTPGPLNWHPLKHWRLSAAPKG